MMGAEMRRAALILALVPLALPASAAAAPEGGSLSVNVRSGIADGGKTFVARGQRVEVRGVMSNFVPLQFADVEVTRAGRRVASDRVLIRRKGSRGAFTFHFTAKRAGRYTVRAVHEATAEQGTARAERASVEAVSWQAGQGASGLRVRVLQRGLAALAYVTPRGGGYDAGTARAVTAFRKVNRMQRTGYASRKVFDMVLRGDGGFRLKYPNHGKHVEADLSRQVLVLARDGRAERIYHTSSGTSATPTIRGSYTFYRKDPGTNSLGMVHSSYFRGGYAIHGYKSVPTHPASHGCLRVPIPNALSIFRWINTGDRIDVYR